MSLAFRRRWKAATLLAGTPSSPSVKMNSLLIWSEDRVDEPG
jgi:hypothetical protein